MQSGAPFVLDLRQDGPHALVAGTTGAGKSEFLQALIVGLATMHSPERVTFLLVDYKGGAAFKECVNLPHTVGMVTDLDRNEVRRALISLNAELHHRELLLQKADAKDLMEMERKGHPDTPPSLLIVVDEFAALAKEIPEFVDGVVDVALRGRSLGLHLVLATQRPAGVITGQIRANTNLRVALRMAADDESADVVGSPVAAAIERRLPGRAVARIGPAGAGAVPERLRRRAHARRRAAADGARAPVRLRPRHGRSPRSGASSCRPSTRATCSASSPTTVPRSGCSGVPAPRRPWLPSLAANYELGPPARVAATTWRSCSASVTSRPASCSRSPTSAPTPTAACSCSAPAAPARRSPCAASPSAPASPPRPAGTRSRSTPSTSPAAASTSSRRCPHVGSVIAGDDTERVTRLLRTLRERIDQRAVAFAEVRASSLPEYRRTAPDGATTSRIIVLLDSYPGFQAMHERIEAGRWLDLFTRLVADGRQVGVHFVITSDRRTSVPMALVSSLPRRLVLRLSSDDEYANAGEPAGILSATSPPGRAIIDGQELQVAVLGGSANGERQADAIAALADAPARQRRRRRARRRRAARRAAARVARLRRRRRSGSCSRWATPTSRRGP